MRIYKITTLACATLLGLATARAEQIRLTPIQDVLIASGDKIAEPRNLGVSNRGGDYIRRTLLQFDLSDIAKPGRSIEKISLQLTASGYAGTEGGLVPVAVWASAVTPEWNEADLVWSTAPWTSTSLESGRGVTGLQRLAAVDFNADTELAKRPSVIWESEGLTAYIRRQAGKIVTLVLVAEGDNKTPGIIFFSKDNRPVAKAVYPVLLVTLK
jgi:hypothetical protein